ncbi:magnesium transporter CorA family protein [Nakamurella multipartita]|mgnify:CR=1 FL=1|uniref:Mg2 transporter protein CorA family protein n=1 Tax=Nakamurella multipartita (strain ATCC 700099 / DSM 44233 / CIP 104796 / JCM 9543 / NBRC 105858 / Y-104) TaxID=479431 RepID=C8XB21_NAKMY|nr:Mg2 transporter protein CorA family protein [Nakamurella multipartita DSM 44233]
MDVRFVRTSVADDGPVLTEHAVAELPQLLARTDGVTWVDVPTWDAQAEQVLTEVFGFHPLAIRDCRERNQVPKVHVYPGHVFLVLHAPHPGHGGHVHFVELDQFIGTNFLVTTHGPLNPAVDPAAATVETSSLIHRLESGRLRPTAAYELSHGLTSSLTGRLRTMIASLTQEVWGLEQRVTGGHLGDAEQFLEEMFRARHGLLAVETIASLSREVYARMAKIEAFGPAGELLLEDSVDQFERLRSMAHGQKEYLVGTIEFYQARTNTKMTIAAERLAVIAAVTLPITALSSIYGMNVIVNDETHYGQLAILLTIMLAMSISLLIWSKRKGWW